jgi:hypothetical protein
MRWLKSGDIQSRPKFAGRFGSPVIFSSHCGMMCSRVFSDGGAPQNMQKAISSTHVHISWSFSLNSVKYAD